ncbi:MAG: hypothetical protein GXY47_07415 [Acidobacteria bacterium]|nr:hypothetical protein [Acidobacteriota bacterium]
MKMQQLEYEVRFLTPAFLGNAEQSAQWRTPPFKALLRQWWRVAAAPEVEFPWDFTQLREMEGRLFGHAWLESDSSSARQSKILLRLNHWNEGTLKSWAGLGRNGSVTHPEVPKPVGSDLYLGYGPLVFKGGTALKANAAIQPAESAVLSLALPEKEAALINQTMWLIDRFGTIGGRSRNGWGSLSLKPLGNTPELQGVPPLRNWMQCLDLDWPHALGCDGDGLLAWETQSFDDWKLLMKELALVKIGLRTQFRFTTGREAEAPEPRHWLSYPVTNHWVRSWERSARLPNTLRFKIRRDAQDERKLRGIIFHMPCLPPESFRPDRQNVLQVWQRVHSFLSQQSNLTRVQE